MTDEEMARIRLLTLSVKRARGLVPCDGDSQCDAFCEVFWYGELVGKTKVADGTLTPVWNEAFKLPYKAAPSALRVDCYHNTYMGKVTLSSF